MANSIVLNMLFKKEYLKEFLIAFMGNQYPIEVTEKSIIGKILKPLVESPPAVPPHIQLQKDIRVLRDQYSTEECQVEKKKLQNKIASTQALIKEYKEGTTLMVHLHKFQGMKIESINYISLQNQRHFELIIHELFKLLFNNYIDVRMEAGFNKTDSINSFCYRYNIPMNAINFEMLKKKHDRYIKRNSLVINNNKNVLKMSRELSRRLTSLQILAM